MGMGPTQLVSALGVGLIAVFWAYDGWVYITWVAGEVKEPRRNVPLGHVVRRACGRGDLSGNECDLSLCSSD